MNKEYMLSILKDAIEALEKEYRFYFDANNCAGKSENGAATMRSRLKKDIGLCKLIEYLVMRCPGTLTVDNAELCAAFDRITDRALRRK